MATAKLRRKRVAKFVAHSHQIVLIAAWLIGHLYDASYWYNRNLVIIANIERQFLAQSDLRDVHYYFGKHRKKGEMIAHLRIQYALAVGIAGVVVFFHFVTRVIPGFGASLANLDLVRSLPYAMMIVAAWFLTRLRTNREAAYAEFLANSPGKRIDTTGLTFGVGHPTD